MLRELIAILFASVGTAVGQTVPASQPSAGTAVFVGDELLHDYRPRSTVVTRQTPVARPKFPAIDFHCHWSIQQDPHRMLAAMDELGISHAVNLSGSFGAEFEDLIGKFHAVDRERFIFFVNLDFSRIDEPDFRPAMASWLEAAQRRGARGLKIFKSLGLDIRDKSGQLIRVDDPRLDPVWEKCGQIGFPVLIHAGDPAAFFQPVDAANERWMQLRRNPGWSYAKPGMPTYAEVIAQRNRVIGRHPGTTFVVAHMAESANDYATLGGWLEKHPNMMIDLSARENEIGRQPRASREFFIRHADRIVFGTDRYPGRLDQPRNRVYYRILETDDEYFDYYDHPFPPMGEWKVYGLGLPVEVLAKIYRENARRILGLK